MPTRSSCSTSTNVDVTYLSDDEWREASKRGLARLGLTYDELAAQAKARNFSSTDALQLWMAIGGDRP